MQRCSETLHLFFQLAPGLRGIMEGCDWVKRPLGFSPASPYDSRGEQVAADGHIFFFAPSLFAPGPVVSFP